MFNSYKRLKAQIFFFKPIAPIPCGILYSQSTHRIVFKLKQTNNDEGFYFYSFCFSPTKEHGDGAR